jgi:hypothetical protein
LERVSGVAPMRLANRRVGTSSMVLTLFARVLRLAPGVHEQVGGVL